MYYRIKFKATPKEFVFEAVKQFVLVKDMMQTIRKNFKIYQDDLIVYTDGRIQMDVNDCIENGRTYVVKRIPSSRVKYRRKRKLKWLSIQSCQLYLPSNDASRKGVRSMDTIPRRIMTVCTVKVYGKHIRYLTLSWRWMYTVKVYGQYIWYLT